ncbi:probable ubiquitin carboxyl-terminal hydrolase FAF-X [Dermacentor silvarum]|uniref:probable ubiquitin carboxyl-terminal hydrolase FAF-X n=1 Tax=Dermacentor silvarum TaxID=543639 RepID=UPI0021007B27|nr:probable ubiquitin carboxyl-terminal hydrolase FAF-X [Dermacentor silvarum]
MTARGNPQQQQQGSGGGDQEPPPASNHEEVSVGSQPQQQLAEEPPAEEAPPFVVVEEEEEEFPLAELARLDEMINRPRWVVPVLPKGELEVLLEAAIRLCRQGRDVQSEPCQRFFREGLTISFTKILTDEAVSGWKFEIHRCIMKNCERLVELCVTKLHQDWFPLLDLLAMVLNPHNKFHSYNGTRPSDSVPPGSQIPDDQVFARPVDTRTPKGWVVDLINRFGNLGGFTILLERFRSGPPLSVAVIAALIRPFGLCHSLLTVPTVERYLMPIVSLVPAFLERLSDEELKREAKNESKNDALAAIVRALRSLAAMVPHQEETVRALEMFRLRMILRWWKVLFVLEDLSPFSLELRLGRRIPPTAMSAQDNLSTSTTTTPAQPSQSVVAIHNRHHDPPVFASLRGDDVEEWLQNYNLGLTSDPVLCHFDQSAATIIHTDTSSHGLGAVLLQRDTTLRKRVVAYACRALTAAEKNYTITEQECLVVTRVQKSRPYLYGRHVTVVTDHKALCWL